MVGRLSAGGGVSAGSGAWRRWVKPVFLAAVGVFLALAVRRALRDAAHLPTPRPAWLALAAALYLGHYAIQALGWHLILSRLGQPVRLRQSVRLWYATLIARWIPGPMVYTAARLVMAREAGLSVTAVAFAVVFELLYILLGSVVATASFAGGMLPGLLRGGGWAPLAGGAAALLVCGALVLRPSFLVALCRIPLLRRVIRRIAGEDLPEQGIPAMTLGSSLTLLAFYSLFWVYSGAMFGVLANAFLPMDTARWLACVPAFPGSWLAGFLAVFAPAGLGVREGAMWLMLRHAMPQAEAVLLAVASRLMMLATELLGVGIVWLAGTRAARLPKRLPGNPS